MRKLALEIAVAAALTVAAILSLVSPVHANEIIVQGAYARASASPAAKAGAAYFTIINRGGGSDHLTGVSADVSASAIFHESKVEDGVATMRHIEDVGIPAGREIAFSPGGLHVMLMGLRRPLKAGEHFALTLKFERAGDVLVDVPVGGVAASAPP